MKSRMKGRRRRKSNLSIIPETHLKKTSWWKKA
jgi:hypothetical protein